MVNIGKNNKKVFIASDHAGFELKEFLINEFQKSSLNLVDLGCDSATISVDYPRYTQKLCKEIDSDNSFGILICGSGIGVSIAANRFKKIRAALCNNVEMAKLSRAHNNANVLCLGARFITKEEAILIINNFLNSNFEAGRHEKRVEQLTE